MSYQINWSLAGDDMTPEKFLNEYWQKKPLFIRGAITNEEGYFVVPIEADELAGLAMEEDIQSRIVGQKVNKDWFVEHGPFEDFSQFGEEYWTLLVQATNNWSVSTHEMLKPFRFLPNWRIDDVMVSFSTPNGGVGPHLDQYDVFIIQGEGERRWQVGLPDESLETVIPHYDLKQVTPFEPVIDEITRAGDLLYIPPNHPHNGVAIQNSMNYSIGFQAPNNKELFSGFADNIIDKELGEERFGDKDRSATHTPQNIEQADFDQLKAFMLAKLDDNDVFNHFICQHLTTSHHTLDILIPEESFSEDKVSELIEQVEKVSPVPGIKSIFNNVNNTLYVNAEYYALAEEQLDLANALAKGEPLTSENLKSFNFCLKNVQLLTSLLNHGYWYFE